MANNDQILTEQEWNKAVQKAVAGALGAQLDGQFLAANYVAGFPYIIRQQYYNKASLSALDTLIKVQDDIPSLGDSFSSLYHSVIKGLEYNFSTADQAKLDQEQTALAALAGPIIEAYKTSGLDEQPNEYATVMYIMQRIKEVTGTDYAHVDTRSYPNLGGLCAKISQYAQKSTNTLKLQNAWLDAVDRLDAISDHIAHPADANGGLKVDASTCVAGWENLMDSTALLNSLKSGNSVSVSLTSDSISTQESALHFDTQVTSRVPFNWFFSLTVKHEHEYDLSQFASKESSLTVTVTYQGLTLIPAVPAGLTADNSKGWFSSQVLREAAAKSGQDATGYQLASGELDPDALFGPAGTLRRMKSLVLSRQPEIHLTFRKFDEKALSELFVQNTDVSFGFFGGLIHGDHANDYTFSNYQYDAAQQTVEVSILPAPLESGAASSQTACVLGGVPEYYER